MRAGAGLEVVQTTIKTNTEERAAVQAGEEGGGGGGGAEGRKNCSIENLPSSWKIGENKCENVFFNLFGRFPTQTNPILEPKFRENCGHDKFRIKVKNVYVVTWIIWNRSSFIRLIRLRTCPDFLFLIPLINCFCDISLINCFCDISPINCFCDISNINCFCDVSHFFSWNDFGVKAPGVPTPEVGPIVFDRFLCLCVVAGPLTRNKNRL